MSSFTHHATGAACSVCQAAVPRGRLMCPTHWRLVPKSMQLRVWRTWEALTPHAQGTPEQRLKQIADYRAAADDATAHVRTYHLEPSK